MTPRILHLSAQSDMPRRVMLGRLGLLLVTLLLLAACQSEPAAITPPPPVLTADPPDAAAATLAAFEATEPPARDLADLARRFRGVTVDVVAAPQYAVGDVAPFYYKDNDANQTIETTAVLAFRSDDLNMWIESGADYDDQALEQSIAFIENNIIPTNRAFFGVERQPGIDDDPRVTLLHLTTIDDTTVGYFSEADTFPRAVSPFSNERELLYINIGLAPFASPAYEAVVAHEMQHLIHWSTDANEAIWLEEGLGELAAFINTGAHSGFIDAFVTLPDTQLNQFDYQGTAGSAHYGASFLFGAYFLDRFGEEATKQLVRHPENGIAGFEATLDDLGESLTFDDLFADWVAANYLDGRAPGEGLYTYRNLDVPAPAVAATHDQYPVADHAAVSQYGVDYIELNGDSPLTLVFTGTRQVPLLDAVPHSGAFIWSTYPADASDMTLTRPLDLTAVDAATLSFWTWYEIESGWDYAYVTLSTDEGATWQPLETIATTRFDPQGNSYGPGFSGNSGSAETPQWIEQMADLTSFAGQTVLLRFEYVTDDALYLSGFALDDITVPEIGFRDDAESDAAGWEAAGFVRHANILPQRFLTQLFLIGQDEVRVERMSLDAAQNGRWSVSLGGPFDTAVFAVSGLTPYTSRPAAYRYQVETTP